MQSDFEDFDDLDRTDADRTNFRLELSLVDDSDNIVPAGSSLRVKAVIKFDVPSDKTNGWPGYDPDFTGGRFGETFNLQAGSTLRIAGPFEWENAGGRTLRIDPDRMGVFDYDPPYEHASCQVGGVFVDDYTNDVGRVIYSVANSRYTGESGGSLSCGADPPTKANGRVFDPTPDDWKHGYSNQGYFGTFSDALPDRDGIQGPCMASTVDDVTTWTCELILVDEQFGWRGNNAYASLNGLLPRFSDDEGVPNWEVYWLIPARAIPNADDAKIMIPEGTPDGAFTISGSIVLHSNRGRVPAQAARNEDKMVLTDTLTVQVGTVSEAASATFGFATQTATDMPADGVADQPWPAQIPANGGRTKLRLQVLNENGQPSARNSLSSIVMRTNLGMLTSNIDDGETGAGDGCIGTGGLACQVPVSSLDTTNSGNIVFTLNAPPNHEAGTAQITGSVVNSRGEVLPIETLTVTFVGTASTIALSNPSSNILNIASADNRDQLTLSVSATDAAGQRAEVPTRSRATTVKGPDGRTVAQGISVEWPLYVDPNASPQVPALDAENNLQARITVSAAAASALKPGEYTLEVRAGGLKATQTFTVVGEAASLEVVASESEFRLNDQFTLTATVTNADGSLVPDGTPVSFTTGSEVTGQNKIVQLRSPQGTKNGQDSATYVVVAEGRTWVTVSSGAGNDIWIANVGATPRPPGAAVALSGRVGLVSYVGDAAVQASALLQALDNVTTIRLYRAGAWVLYGVVDGRVLPGSEDFTVTRGNVLWIGN